MPRAKWNQVDDVWQLQNCFWQQILRHFPVGKWSALQGSNHLSFNYNGRSSKFHLVAAREVKPRDMMKPTGDLDVLKKMDPKLLALTVRLGPDVLAECRRRSISCADLTGHMLLMEENDKSDENFWVELQLKPHAHFQLPWKELDESVVDAGNVSILSTILQNPVRGWNISQLQYATKLSSATVSMVLDCLSGKGWVKCIRRGDWRLVNAGALQAITDRVAQDSADFEQRGKPVRLADVQSIEARFRELIAKGFPVGSGFAGAGVRVNAAPVWTAEPGTNRLTFEFNKKVSHFQLITALDIAREDIFTATISADEIKDFLMLVTELREQFDAVSAFLWNRLSDPEQLMLRNYQPSAPDLDQMQAIVVKALNNIIGGKSIYDDLRFQDIPLRPETVDLLKRDPSGPDLVLLNRLLLEDAYPLELSRNHDIAGASGSMPPLLVTARLGDDILDLCRRRRISCADLTGRMLLLSNGWVETLGDPSLRFRTPWRDGAVFAGGNLNIPLALLQNPSRCWNLSQLQQETALSLGSVWRVVNYMEEQGWAKRVRRGGWRLAKAERLRAALRNAPANAVSGKGFFIRGRRLPCRHYEVRCYSRAGDLNELATPIRDKLQTVRFAHETADSLRKGQGVGRHLVLYAPRFLTEDEVAELGLSYRYKGGGNVRVMKPVNNFILGLGQEVSGFPLALL